MNNRIFGSLLSAVVVCLLLSTHTKAQTGDYEFWDGGSNTWEASASLGNETAGYTVEDWNGGPNGTDWINYSNAVFNSAPGTVTVQDYTDPSYGGYFPPVYVGSMEFNSSISGTYDITGDPITSYNDQALLVQVDSGNNANIQFDSDINVDLSAGNESTYVFNNSTTSTLTFGNINFTTSTDPNVPPNDGTTINRNDQNLSVHGVSGSTTIFNGMISADSNLQSTGVFGDYGTDSSAIYEINGGLTYTPRGGPGNKEFDFASGNILVGTSNLGTGSICFVGNGNGDNGTSPAMEFLTDTAGLTITNLIYAQNQSNAEIGGDTAGATTYTGQINAGQGGGRLRLNAAAGGVVTFDGDIGGNNSYTLTSGSGTIVLNQATGNDYSVYTPDAFEMSSGTTTLIQNTSGSAFGSTTSAYAQIDAGATLGGSGISSQQVVAASHTSVIAPGNGTTINTLHLLGGLTTTGVNGLTMKFDLNGAANDLIDVGSSAMVLNGPIDVSFTNLGTVLTGTPYTLISGTGAWTGVPVFDVTAPTGYILNALYGVDGVEYTTTGGADSLSVEFDAAPIPEPSPIMLLSVSIAGLAFVRWARRLHSLNA